MSRRLLIAALTAAVALAGALALVPGVWAGSTVGSFEIDGNLKDDSGAGEPIDWATPPPNLTNFADKAGGGDDVFGQGSKELEPGGWTCLTGKAPGKDDIVSGQTAFRTFNGDQFVYVNFTRAATNGDAHIDYEFNQSSVPNPICPQTPSRTTGDIVITFDTEQGGQQIIVRAFRWIGTAALGTFQELPLGSKGVTFDGAVNIPNTIPGHKAGDFGEAALNLTKTIGEFGCNQFATVYMKSRASTAINSELKDRTSTRKANVGNCPSSDLAKAVRNVSDGQQFSNGGPTSTTADPGETIEYRLTYTNNGPGAAHEVVITEEVPARSTFLSCTGGCTNAGTSPGSKITWNLGTVEAGGTRVVTFRTRLDTDIPDGTQIKNVATVTTKEEGSKPSNETTVTVVVPLACTGHAFDIRLDLTGVVGGFVGPAVETVPDKFPDIDQLSHLELTVPATPPDPPVVTADTLVAENSGNPTAGCKARITYEDLFADLHNLGASNPDIPVTLSVKAVESVAIAKGSPPDTFTDVTIVDGTLTIGDPPNQQVLNIPVKPAPNTTLVDLTTPDPDGLGTVHVKAVLHERFAIPNGVAVNAIRVKAELKNLLGQITQTADLKVAHAEADVEPK